MRRVVVTGIGVISPLAANAKNSWDKLINGYSGIKKIQHFSTEDLPAKIAGLVPRNDEQDAFNPLEYMSTKELKKVDDFITYGYAAAIQAINDSQWFPDNEKDKNRTGVIIGSGIGGLPKIYETSIALYNGGFRKVSPFFIPASLINLIAGHVAIKYGFTGPNHAPVTACASGSHAIGDAMRIIQYGDADIMIAGGAEAAVCRIGMAGFAAARALSTEFNDQPSQASRPWDQKRDGFVMGEGAGILVLEELNHAKARNAKIYAEVVGYGSSGDAYHITTPHADGLGPYLAMEMARKNAKINVEQLDYINAHGTSTPVGDVAEIKALRKILGKHIHKTAISSTKSSIGHLLGAAGGVEAAFTVLAIINEILPPTLNLDSPSVEFSDINFVPHVAQEKKIQYAMSNSFGFGGTNAALIFKAYTE